MIRAAAVVAVSLLIGCGGGGSGDDAGPATAVPADALVYAEAVVRPEGAVREDALDAAGKVLDTDDPEARIRELAFEDHDLDWERDVEPWLGERAAFWTAGDRRGVALLEVTDDDAAREAVTARLEREGGTVSERSHRGVDYVVGSDGRAGGVVGDFLAVGRETDVKRTIDAAEGNSLADSDEYADAVGALPDERLAHFWVDTPGLVERAMRRHPELDQLRGLVPVDEIPPVAAAFLANGDRLALEVFGKGLGVQTGSTPLLQELPGDSWAAAGSADVGRSLRDALDRFAGVIGGVAIRGHVRRELGLDLDRDVLEWVGDAAFFVRGASPGSVDGGIVIQPTDENRAADAFGRIVGAIQQAGDARAQPVEIEGADQAFAIRKGSARKPIVLARGSGLVVATYGEAAAQAALGDDDRLGDTDVYSEAEELVGMEPSLLVSMPQVLAVAGPDPEARRYLDAFSVIAASGKEGSARIAAGLR